jgi:hypothetical protein
LTEDVISANIESALQMNYCGIFATHQHDLLSEELGLLPMLDRNYVQRMVTQSVAPPAQMPDGRASVCKVWLQPTFQVAPGTSTESMALQVANREVRSAQRECMHALSKVGRLHADDLRCHPGVFYNDTYLVQGLKSQVIQDAEYFLKLLPH